MLRRTFQKTLAISGPDRRSLALTKPVSCPTSSRSDEVLEYRVAATRCASGAVAESLTEYPESLPFGFGRKNRGGRGKHVFTGAYPNLVNRQMYRCSAAQQYPAHLRSSHSLIAHYLNCFSDRLAHVFGVSLAADVRCARAIGQTAFDCLDHGRRRICMPKMFEHHRT